MKSLKLLFLLFVIPVAGIQAQEIEQKFQQVLDSVYQSNANTVGLMVHVESPSRKISWSGAAGFAEKGINTPINAEQPGLIASNTKTFVAATILILQEQRKLTIHQSIKTYLPVETIRLLDKNMYVIDSIKIENLMSHTSGIRSFANQAYMDAIVAEPKHRWTRNEQIEWAMNAGPPLAFPGRSFEYSDTNYLLLTEIIEEVTGLPFYHAMRELLQYEANGLHDIWFPTLEEKPAHTLPRVHQYWDKVNLNSYDFDVSVDLYGGGGIACTTRDLALFNYKLFNGEIVKNKAVFNLIYTDYPTLKEDSHYHLGIADTEIDGQKAYGHNGFWGTKVMYFPELETAISVYVLVRDESSISSKVLSEMLKVMRNGK